MFSIDTNLLVYAHNKDSEFNKKAVDFLEKVLNDRDEKGNLSVCLTTQVLIEFINVITRQTLGRPVSIPEAIQIINDYSVAGIKILSQRNTQLRTFLELLGATLLLFFASSLLTFLPSYLLTFLPSIFSFPSSPRNS